MSEVKAERPLTARQELFVREYLVDFNASGAYRRAGYKSEDNVAEAAASRLLRNVKVKSAIDKAMEKRKAKVELTAEKVIADILEIQARCMQKEAVMYFDKINKEYRQVTEEVPDENAPGGCREEGVWKFDAGNALKASELLGKHLKLFTDKMEVEDKSEIRIIMDKDAEDWGG